MKAKLVVVGEDQFTREFPVEDELEIGRSATGWDMVARRQGEDKLVGIRDSSVSKKHAMIYVDSGKLLIRDLGSSNGTMLNNRFLSNWHPKIGSDPAEIKGDCVIRLGNTEMEVKVEAPPMYDELAKMVQELRLDGELARRHPEKDAQRLANSFRVILDINNNCCNTQTRVKEISSRFNSLKMYLTEEEFVSEVEGLQRRLTAAMFDEEFLREEHVRELKSFCTRLTEMWGASFMK